MKIKEMLKGMLETRDCLGLQEHKVLTLNTVYKYLIEEPKTTEMERLKDFGMSCFREGWIHAVSIIQDFINKEDDFNKILYMKFGEINLSGETSQFKKKVKKYNFKKNDAVILHISIPKDNIVRLVNIEPITQEGIRQVIKEAEEYSSEEVSGR